MLELKLAVRGAMRRGFRTLHSAAFVSAKLHSFMNIAVLIRDHDRDHGVDLVAAGADRRGSSGSARGTDI
jgi:hypothetical protein